MNKFYATMYVCPRQISVYDVNWQLHTAHKINFCALGAMVTIFVLRSTFLLKVNNEKHNPEWYLTINYTCSWLQPNRGRVSISKYHPRFRTNKREDKNITTSAANEETSEPRSMFLYDKPLTHTRKRLLFETTKTKLFHPWASGDGSSPGRARGSGEPPPPGREGGEGASPPSPPPAGPPSPPAASGMPRPAAFPSPRPFLFA